MHWTVPLLKVIVADPLSQEGNRLADEFLACHAVLVGDEPALNLDVFAPARPDYVA